MYTKRIAWKSFKIDLASFHNKMKMIAGAKYIGATAHDVLELHFSELLGVEQERAIQEAFDRLTEGDEAKKIEVAQARQKALSRAKERLPYADLLSLIPAEKKLLIGAELTDEEKDTLIDKHSG